MGVVDDKNQTLPCGLLPVFNHDILCLVLGLALEEVGTPMVLRSYAQRHEQANQLNRDDIGQLNKLRDSLGRILTDEKLVLGQHNKANVPGGGIDDARFKLSNPTVMF